MDLPTCPHCGQSVLEDDVEDCPFCGESMTGKPSTGKKKATAAKPAATKSGPGVSTLAKKGANREKSNSGMPTGDSLIEKETAKKYIRLRPQPKPGRTWEVVCPMCETKGFTTAKASELPVRCCNPDCLVPIFEAPKYVAEPDTPDEVEEPTAFSKEMLAVVGVLIFGGLGFGVWFFFLRPDPQAAQDALNQPAITDAELRKRREEINRVVGQTDPTPDNQTDPMPKNGENRPSNGNTNDPPGNQAADAAAVRAQLAKALEQMKLMTQYGERQGNRSKPFCVQLFTEALATSGDLSGAKQQLQRLGNFRDTQPRHRILTRTAIAKGQILHTKEPPEKTLVEDAFADARTLDGTSQVTWNAILETAALQVILGNDAAAAELAGKVRATAQEQAVWAEIYWARLTGEYTTPPVEVTFESLHSPVHSMIAATVSFWGMPQAGYRWAVATDDPRIQADSLGVWAAATVPRLLARNQPIDEAALPVPSALGTAESTAAIKVRYFSAVAAAMARGGKPAQASNWIKQATEAAKALPSASPQSDLPDIAAVNRFQRPAVPEARNRLIAAARCELGIALMLSGDGDGGWQQWQQAFQALRELAPAADLLRQRIARANRSPRLLREELRDALKLNTDDATRRAEIRYLAKANEMLRLAESVESFARVLFTTAAKNGAAERLAQQWLQSESDWRILLNSELPHVVQAQLRQANQSDIATQLTALLEKQRIGPPQSFVLLEKIQTALVQQKAVEAAEAWNQRDQAVAPSQRLRIGLRACIDRVAADQLATVYQFCRALNDPYAAETIASYASSQAVSLKQVDNTFLELERQRLNPTLKAAGFHGCVLGVLSGQQLSGQQSEPPQEGQPK